MKTELILPYTTMQVYDAIKSVDMPRLYWKPLEKTGIQQEHEYVFDNLKRDLIRKHGR